MKSPLYYIKNFDFNKYPPSFIFMLLALFLAPVEFFYLDVKAVDDAKSLGYYKRLIPVNISFPDIALFLSAFFLFIKKEKLRIPRLYPFVAFTIFTVLSIVSCFYSVTMKESFKAVLQYAYFFYILIPVVCSVLNTQAKFLAACVAFMVGILCNLIPSLLVFILTGSYSFARQDEFLGVGGMTRAAHVGGCLFLSLTIHYLRQVKVPKTLAFFLFFVLAFVLEVFSFNRSSIGALFLGMFVVISLSVRGRASLGKILLQSAVAVAVVVLIIFIGFDHLPPALKTDLTNVSHGLAADSSAFNRLRLAKSFLAQTDDLVLHGWGHEGVEAVMKKRFKFLSWAYLPHNAYISWWGGAGLIGLLAMLYACLACIRAGWAVISRSPPDSLVRALTVGILAAYIGFLGHYMLHASIVRRIDWFLWALLLAASGLPFRPSASDTNRQENKRKKRIIRLRIRRTPGKQG